MKHLKTVRVVFGLALVVAGLWLIYPPLACIVAGLILVLF